MKELEYLDIINKTLSDVSLLGDDCAYLKDFDLCITQDSLVENVHFSLKTTDAYTLGQKAVNVNLSDLAAAGAVPLFVTISLSLPKNKDIDFVKDFYKGVEKSVSKYGVSAQNKKAQFVHNDGLTRCTKCVYFYMRRRQKI